MPDDIVSKLRAELRKMTKGDLLRMVSNQKGKNACWEEYVLFFWSIDVLFFVSPKSWDKGARSKGKS
jgi:hypothetical protein